VLLVDDEPDQVEMYRYSLEESGFAVISANTGADAVTRAREQRPDVIVLDVRLPDMSGWDVCAALKTDPRTERIPIVILTAVASTTLARDAANAGCVAHLLKPCYPSELTESVRTVLAAT
jgi:two-component system phosphate regulon response regulator PhoB